MKRVLNGLKAYWPIIGLGIVELAIEITNIAPKTFLAGWDNLMPEFNFPLNFFRSLFGVWLEYRGTGIYDGMSHIANLVQILIVWLMSFAIPQELLRYSFNLCMHLLGGIGAYLLIKQLFHKKTHAETQVLGFIGGLFYMLNLATVQMFYAPLEAYSVYFACLPWLSWGLIHLYTNRTKSSYLLFFTIALLSTPAFFVITLLFPIAILLGSISILYLAKDWNLHIRHVLVACIGFLLINSFWLLPYI